jgi:hypothetical protein
MTACCAPFRGGRTLSVMALLAAQQPRRQQPRLVERPVLFRRTRKTIADFVGFLWLAIVVVRLVRSRHEARSRGRRPARAKERIGWSQ